jgi:hypothetical protein
MQKPPVPTLLGKLCAIAPCTIPGHVAIESKLLLVFTMYNANNPLFWPFLCAGAEEEEAALEAEAAAIEAEAHKASVSGEAEQRRLIARAWTAHKSPDGQVSTTAADSAMLNPHHHDIMQTQPVPHSAVLPASCGISVSSRTNGPSLCTNAPNMQ